MSVQSNRHGAHRQCVDAVEREGGDSRCLPHGSYPPPPFLARLFLGGGTRHSLSRKATPTPHHTTLANDGGGRGLWVRAGQGESRRWLLTLGGPPSLSVCLCLCLAVVLLCCSAVLLFCSPSNLFCPYFIFSDFFSFLLFSSYFHSPIAPIPVPLPPHTHLSSALESN